MQRLCSGTTSATIYYTLDGSTPTNASPLHVASPATITLALTTNVKTIFKSFAYDVNNSAPLSDVSTAEFCGYGYKAGDLITDDHGNKLINLSGGVSVVAGVYYWVGTYINDTGNSSSGLWMYSSTDFMNWRLVGQVADDNTQSGPYRAHIIYCAGCVSGAKYVLWAANWGVFAAVGVAATVTGPYTWVNTALAPDGMASPESLYRHDRVPGR